MKTDAILALNELGYTQREAAFLSLVAIHSGYFLRRQFDYFVDRIDGNLAQRFVEKARLAGHIAVLDYGQRYLVNHLFYKPIYRLLGDAESQNRRRKGDAAIRARLISLDYVLGHEGLRYLEYATERQHFFARVRRIPLKHFCEESGNLSPLLAAYPIAIADRNHPVSSQVRFVFADESLMSIEKFKRFIAVAESLLRSLGNFEVIYCAHSEQNFAAALHEFRRKFDAKASNNQQFFSEDWNNRSQISPQFDPTLQAKFTTLLFNFSYPKLRRDETASPMGTHPSKTRNDHQLFQQQQHGKNTGSNAG